MNSWIKSFWKTINQKQYFWVMNHPVDSPEQIKELQVFLNKWNEENKKILVDGKMGPKTLNAWFDCMDGLFGFWCDHHGFIYSAQAIDKSRRRQNPKPSRVIWHWTSSGRTAVSLGRLWETDSRIVSSHAGIDEEDIIFYAPLHRVTYHAGQDNEDSIGIDICSPPLNNPESEHRAKTRGIYAGTSPDDKYLYLHDKVLFNINRVKNAINQGLKDIKYQDHAFVDPTRKIDCIPWRQQLSKIGAFDV